MKKIWFLRKIGKRITQLITLISLIVIAFFVYSNKEDFNPSKTHTNLNPATSENTPESLINATILRVVDGDTVIVIRDNEEVKVRMIGVNTPESVHSDASKNTEEGKIASKYTKSMLKEGMTVYLEYDMQAKDDYGRDLAYIWLSSDIDTSSYEDFCKYNYGAILLQNTYCEAVYYKPNGKYKAWYEQLDKTNE